MITRRYVYESKKNYYHKYGFIWSYMYDIEKIHCCKRHLIQVSCILLPTQMVNDITMETVAELMLSMLGKKFSRRNFAIFFLRQSA